jgi:hypothetical protein
MGHLAYEGERLMPRPGELDTGDHDYVEGAPYWVTLEKWDPESIDSPERYWPYERGSGADRGVIPAPHQSERSDAARSPLGASPARIPGPHLTLVEPDPEGDA